MGFSCPQLSNIINDVVALTHTDSVGCIFGQWFSAVATAVAALSIIECFLEHTEVISFLELLNTS